MKSIKHLFKKENDYILYDSATLNLYKLPNELNVKLDELKNRELDELANNIKIESNESMKENDIKLDKCNRLVIVISDLCNLKCKYCFANGGAYANKELRLMDFDKLKVAIKSIIDIYPKGIEYIQFFGGEPLTNKKLLKLAPKWINEYMEENKLPKPKYTIVTNGTLIDKQTQELFNKYFSSVTISLDGIKPINDKNRVFSNNDISVHDVVVRKINEINRDRKYALDIEMTVDVNHLNYFEKNHSIENYRYVQSLGADSVHIVPDITCNKSNQLGQKYINIAKEYFDLCAKESTGDDVSKINLIKAKSVIEMLYNKRISQNYCSAGMGSIAVDTKGYIYPCFMFIGNEKFIMGNVNETDRKRFKEVQKIFMENKNCKNEKCSKCWANTICSEACSGCVGSFYLGNGSIKKPLDLQCEVGKSVIERTLYEISKYYIKKNDKGDCSGKPISRDTIKA